MDNMLITQEGILLTPYLIQENEDNILCVTPDDNIVDVQGYLFDGKNYKYLYVICKNISGIYEYCKKNKNINMV